MLLPLMAASCLISLASARALHKVQAIDDARSVHAPLGTVAGDGLTAVERVRGLFPDFAAMLAAGEDAAMAQRLRRAETIGRPIGDEAFLSALEKASGRTLAPAKRGPKSKISGVAP